jgi:formylglycine-generating enzyme required for sulfatase activity
MKQFIVALVALGLANGACSSANQESEASGGNDAGGSGGVSSQSGGNDAGGNGAASSQGGESGTTNVTFSGCLDETAWYSANIESIKGEGFFSPTSPGQKLSNAYELYDMLGNAAEWTADCLHDSYDGAPSDGSVWSASNCEYYMMRGGCSSQDAKLLRVSTRSGVDRTGYGSCNVGVRCAADLAATLSDEAASFTWVDIPAGSYEMGCSVGDGDCFKNEFPPHVVFVSAFKLMAKEVTKQQFIDVTKTTSPGCRECADTGVHYGDAVAFCEQLGGRLPSEAEWEYAARGGTSTRYYCGN